MWHDRWHSFLWVWVWVSSSQRIPLSDLARNPHKELVREISCKTGRRRGKASPRVVNIRMQAAGESSQQKSRERRLLSKELGPADPVAGLANVRRWVQRSWWLCGNFARINSRNSPQISQKWSQTSHFLRLELTQVRDSLFFFFFHPLGCVLLCLVCFVKQCEILLAGDERNHLTIRWPWVV